MNNRGISIIEALPFLMILGLIAFISFVAFDIKVGAKGASPYPIQQCDQWMSEAVDPFGTPQGTYKAALAAACYQSNMVQR